VKNQLGDDADGRRPWVAQRGFVNGRFPLLTERSLSIIPSVTEESP